MHHLYNNRTWYGAAKVANEQMYRAFCEMTRMEYVALRYFNVYGPRMDVFGKYTEVLIRWLDCLDEGVRPKIFGDGLQTMDMIFSEDVARANDARARFAHVEPDFVLHAGYHELLDVLVQIAGADG